MKTKMTAWRTHGGTGVIGVLFSVTLMLLLWASDSKASSLWPWHWGQSCGGCCGHDCGPFVEDVGGSWYWIRSPEEEKSAAMGLYNRYCIRCHGVDGRGVWDIPGVPNFTNTTWQASRSDAQIARIIMEGRGAIMPPFRGALHLEEAWGLARYLRNFVPENSRPQADKSPSPG
jgi:hypothetical protein